MIRYAKLAILAALALFCMLAVFGNITDYFTNFYAVQHVLSLKDKFPESTIGYRAITSPILHHVAYIIIISCEFLTGLFCCIGFLKLWPHRKNAKAFAQNQNWAIVGLTMGFLTWQVLFFSIGGEWFGLWMSEQFKSVQGEAFRIYITFLLALVFMHAK